MKPVPTAKRLFRIVALLAPTWIAFYLSSARRPGELERTLVHALGPMWVLLVGGLLLRLTSAVYANRGDAKGSILERIDILTARGAALAWGATIAFFLAIVVGYASLAVVGMLGVGLLHVVALHALLAFRGEDPLRIGSFTRTFTPVTVAEGDDIIEKIRADRPRILVGFRLFITGRVGPRWATSRHVLSSAEGDGEVLLESDVGPALRGEHEPEPLVAWLEDVFGLCRSPRFEVAAPKLTVTPERRPLGNTTVLLDHGIGPRAARAAMRLPTEGYFDLREYKQGDDVRRIHWVRSLAARELVVRLPDELPPDRPRVRLVLDTFFPESLAMDCDAPAEVLDALVGVWLAIGQSLVASGARVTLVTAVPDSTAPARQILSDRSGSAAQQLGARVGWQDRVPVESLLTDEATFVVSRGILTTPPSSTRVRWIIVLPEVSRPKWPFASVLRYPHPSGSSENRWLHRRRLEETSAKTRTDHAQAMLAFGTLATRPPPGSFAAHPTTDGVFQLEAIQ